MSNGLLWVVLPSSKERFLGILFVNIQMQESALNVSGTDLTRQCVADMQRGAPLPIWIFGDRTLCELGFLKHRAS